MYPYRFRIIAAFFILFFVLLEIKIVVTSLFPDHRLTFIPQKQNAVKRGKILGRHLEEMAVTIDTYSLYCRPDQLDSETKSLIYTSFRNYTDFTQEELSGLFVNRHFVWIKRKLKGQELDYAEGVIKYLKEHEMIETDELALIPESGRFYPYGSALNVIGLVGMDQIGLIGIENRFNEQLNRGEDIHTTLDPVLCEIAYYELQQAARISRSESGSVIIVDIDTGEIMAAAGYPTFDPNNLKSLTKENLKFIPTYHIFEPGSVMKQFAAAYALDNHLVSPYYPVFECTGHAYVLDKHIFRCHHPHGDVTLSTIIQKSCNVGMVQVADLFRKNDYYEFLRGLGFGTTPGLPLTSMSPGILRRPEDWSLLSKYMIAIGQEIGVTAFQLAGACTILAGDGIVKPLTIIRNNSENSLQPAENVERIISSQTSVQMMRMMETVVSQQGTAFAARIGGIPVAGKTGTGQVARTNGAGYYDDIFNAVFIGYLPSNKPKYLIVTAINKVHDEKHQGGQVAAPLFAQIVRRMMTSTHYLNEMIEE